MKYCKTLKKIFKILRNYFSFTLIKPMIANMEINNIGRKIDHIIGTFPLLPKS